MTDYTRRDTLKTIGAGTIAALSGCTTQNSNKGNMEEVDNTLEGMCQDFTIQTEESTTLNNNGEEYKVENLAVNNPESAVIRVNGQLNEVDEGYQAHLGDQELEVEGIYQTAPNEGVIKMKYGTDCE